MSAIRMNFFNRELQIFVVSKKLKLITTPTIIMCGNYDVQCPLIYSLEMHDEISGSKLVTFSKSNHYPFLKEKELFLKEVQMFVLDIGS
jgi:proline iminopeptidase